MNFSSLKKLEQKEIIEVLEQLGISERERKVYFALLGFEEATLTPLSRALKLPLTTIQSVLGRLEEKGLVEVSSRKTRHVYKANEPGTLKKILERQMQELSNIMPLLKKLREEEKSSPKIKIYYRERAAEILHKALEAKDKTVYEIVSAKDFQEIIGEKFHFTKRRMQEGVRLKSLRVEEWEIKKYNQKIHERELREAKFLPAELTFRASIMFWDNTVAFFSTKQEGIAWTVESRIISEMIKQLFALLWSVSRRMETLKE